MLMHRIGSVGQQAEDHEVRLGFLQPPGLHLGHGQGFAGGHVVGPLQIDQRRQPFLHGGVRGGVHEREGGFEAGHVADDPVGGGGGGPVEQLHGFLALALLQADGPLLHQRQGLVATRRGLLGLTEFLESALCVSLAEGVERRGIDLGRLGGLARAPGVHAPPAQRAQ